MDILAMVEPSASERKSNKWIYKSYKWVIIKWCNILITFQVHVNREHMESIVEVVYPYLIILIVLVILVLIVKTLSKFVLTNQFP